MKLPKEREKETYQSDIYKAKVKVAITRWEAEKYRSSKYGEEETSFS